MSKQKLGMHGVLMGGAGSTGSSLLRTIINRHDDMFSGEELSLFNKEQYFDCWDANKNKLLPGRWQRFPETRGWVPYRGSALTHEDYCWEENELKALIDQSANLYEFSVRFFERPLLKYGKNIWVEKTPSNCYAFRLFLKSFPGGKVVHTTRNPYDSVASLVRRGMSPYFSAALWLYNTASALSVRDSAQYYLTRYENLVTEPLGEIESLCDFLGVGFFEHLLQPSGNDNQDHSINPGWRADRTASIKKQAESTFSLLPEKDQILVKELLSCLRVSKKHALKKEIPFCSCKEICDELDYEFFDLPVTQINHIRKDHIGEIFHRTFALKSTGIWDFPIELSF